MGLFTTRTKHQNGKEIVPVWFMRQAGRYHAHYQSIKKHSDFMTMCKNPELARDVTMGPIQDFNFDAAILFSDLLFPLEHLGMGLEYSPGPKLSYKLENMDALKKLHTNQDARSFYQFQGQACELLKKSLPSEKTLLGFVGAPITLYTYACEGGHSGNLTDAKKGLHDGRYSAFLEYLIPSVLEEMCIQAENGADAICLFDTAVGELDLNDFKQFGLAPLKTLIQNFKRVHPRTKIVYYSKLTNLDYLRSIESDHIDVLGIDWRVHLPTALKELGKDYYIQGNLDPSHLHLPWELLEVKLKGLWHDVVSSNTDLSKWIFGLGHGVLQFTPEQNVRNTVQFVHENFYY